MSRAPAMSRSWIASCNWTSGSTSLGGEQVQVGAQGGPGRGVADAGQQLLDLLVERADILGAEVVFGGDPEAVEVALGGVAEQQPRVGLVAEQGGGRGGGFVAAEDVFQDVGGGERVDTFGADEGVVVAVADDLQPHVIRRAAAGHHGVELLPGFLPGGHAVHGVDRHPLGAVHGGGVAEFDTGGHVVVGQGDQPSGACVFDLQVPAP